MKKNYLHFLLYLLSVSAYAYSQDELQPEANTAKVDVVCIYTKMFHDMAVKTETFLEVVDQAKEYWQKELFQESLPWTRKNPTYWLHKNSYVKLLHKRIALLTDIENQAAMLLGMALHGQYELSKIDTQGQLQQESLKKGLEPLREHFQVACADLIFENQQKLLHDAQLFSERIDTEIEKFEKIISPHQKPHHLVQHQVAYGCAATAVLASLIFYEAYKDQIPVWRASGKEVIDNFAQTCLTGPVKGLKEILVDNKNTKIQELGPIVIFEKCQNDLTHNRLCQWLGISQDIDTVPKALNDGGENVRVFINQFVPVAETILKSQQINFYLAAIAPALIAMYAGYRCGDALYDRYVRYDWRYKPMKNMVRSIDRLLNNIVQGQQKSFADDGKLHVLILKLKSFMYCLRNEELVLFQEDIAALLSFDLTYAQKQGVVDSMYKTYEFLR